MKTIKGYATNKSLRNKKGVAPKKNWSRSKMRNWAKSKRGQRWAGFSV